MRNYLAGAISQAQERARTLKTKVRSENLPVYFNQLEQLCNGQIDQVVGRLDLISSNEYYLAAANQKERFDELKKQTGLLHLIENVGIAALSRTHADDEILNRLMDTIRKEVRFPIPAPVISTLSRKYYHIFTLFNLMCVPLLEANFLLHLPDIFHELAHPLIDLENNPKVDPFRARLGQFNQQLLKSLENEIVQEERKFGPKAIAFWLRNWKECWILSWSIELFCDIFATLTAGPAFAWSHLHLSATMGGNPFALPLFGASTHPPDHARMTAILSSLDLTGFFVEKQEIEKKWNEYLAMNRFERGPEFDRAFPQAQLEMCAALAYEGTKAIGCRIADPQTQDPVYSLLNSAWKRFWQEPTTYAQWEKENVSRSVLIHPPPVN